MISAALPDNEEERIRLLQELEILDTLEEQAYDDLTFLAAQICDTPIALVSLVDSTRQWFKSHYGLDARETPRELAFCAHAILGQELFVVENSGNDARFHDNPLVTGAPHVKFYAGAPLLLHGKFALGTLCVIDDHPRTLAPRQRQALEALGRQVISQVELRIKVKELQKLDRIKDEFISMVNHELRTPLTAIHGAAGILHHQAAQQLDSASRPMLEVLYRNTNRLLNLVNDILDLSRLEAGRMTLQQQPLSPVDLVGAALELNEAYCKQCGCSIELKTAESLRSLRVLGDEQRLQQVLSNLISNAAKFTFSGDTLEVAVVRVDGHVRINVTDHGPGIAPDKQDRLFQKFSHLSHAGNSKLPGTGLGLVISRQIVELHQGTMGFESIPHQRTSFYFTLPIAAG